VPSRQARRARLRKPGPASPRAACRRGRAQVLGLGRPPGPATAARGVLLSLRAPGRRSERVRP